MNKANPKVQEAINRAVQLQSAGEFAQARKIYLDVLQTSPNHPVALHLLGALSHQTGDHEKAVELISRTLAIAPDYADAHSNLGAALKALGKISAAVESYKKAISYKPNYPAAHYNLAISLATLGQTSEAIESYQRAIDIDPNYYQALRNLAELHNKSGNIDQAIANFQKALAVNPSYASALNSLGVVYQALGLREQAQAFYERALIVDPDDEQAQSNRLLLENYEPENTAETLFIKHQEWGGICDHLLAVTPTHHNDQDPEKPLRIGFVSADLGRHPVGYFVVGLLEHLPKELFQTTCYSDRKADDLTFRIKAASDRWRDTINLSHQDLSHLIRGDEIDILIDLAGHSGKNRLRTFALKPAPILVSWAGYVCTTGLAAMDYFISDRHSTPTEEDVFYTEDVLRMPDGWLSYTPPDYAPDVGPLPCRQRGTVTFGSFSNPSKLNNELIAVWSDILHGVKTARLLIKYRHIEYPETRERITAAFQANGINAARIVLEAQSPHQRLLARYNSVDIALDPFPYSGGLTTYEALWMGVPVITLPGATFASRHSLSHLATLGTTELIARDKADYVRRAIELARSPDLLADYRENLRDKMRRSPICDNQQFANNFGTLMRTIWRSWCARQI